MSERDGTPSLLIRSQKRLRPTTAQIYFIKKRAGLRILVFVAASQISAAASRLPTKLLISRFLALSGGTFAFGQKKWAQCENKWVWGSNGGDPV